MSSYDYLHNVRWIIRLLFYFTGYSTVCSADSRLYRIKCNVDLFLVGIIETAKNAIDTFTKIIALRNKLEKDTIVSLGKRLPNAKALLTYLYSKPVVTVSDVMTNLDVTKQTANALIKDFHNLGILKEQTGYKRNRIFIFVEYMRLFER